MDLNLDDIKGLTRVPKKYIFNPEAIDCLYKNNPNILKNVSEDLHLSPNFIEKITQLINNGTMVLTKDNIKLLDSLYDENIIDILKNHFNYLYLINENNFIHVGIVKVDDFVKLLEEHKIEITPNVPYLVTLCSDYIIKQYIEDKVNTDVILPFFTNWFNIAQRDLIQEYFKKGHFDISIFYDRDEHNGNITPFFKDISIEFKDNNATIKSNNIDSVVSLLNFELPFSISDIYLLDNRYNDISIIFLLKEIKEQNINLHVENGLSISSTLEKNFEFLELCGNVANIELNPFDLASFKELLIKAKDHPGVVINVKLDDFMAYDSYFLNLNTEIPINIISQKNVSILSLNEMKELNFKLDSMVAEIKNSSLSPYEKYIAAYNIVKSFKKYRFYLDNEGIDRLVSDQSRNPYLILTNQYIVCAGYSSLLHLLLKKLDIPSHEWTLDVSDKSNAIVSGTSTVGDAHARLYVSIVDDKYGINGYYMCDPTFDNVDKNISDLYGYKYLSMSCGQSHDYGKDTSSYYYFSRDYDVFNDQMFINTDDYLAKVDSLHEIFMITRDLDPIFYSQLSKLDSKEEQKEAIKKHFKEKTYRAIPLEKKYSAIISVLEFQNKKEFSDAEKQKIHEELYNIDRGIYSTIVIPIPGDDNWDDWDDWDDFRPSK